MYLQENFINYINTHHLHPGKKKLLLAVSGGVDSVVLCELCQQSGLAFNIAHCNFQLRGEESGRDEKFVQALAEKYGAGFFVQKFDTGDYAAKHKLSIQVAARELRYNWFQELLTAEPAKYAFLFTAHHADDNAETVLMNIFKRTGINGLKGILPRQNKIGRPLLFASREEIMGFANENKLQWVEDSSNESEKYTRNYFRRQVIPLIEKVYPAAMDNLKNSLSHFAEAAELYTQAIDNHKKKLLEYRGGEVHIAVLKLQKTKPLAAVLFEILKEYGFGSNQLNDILHLLQSGTGRYVSSSTHRIFKNRNWLIISPLQPDATNYFIIERAGEWPMAGGIFSIKKISGAADGKDNENGVSVDADLIRFPLLLRKWKTGDYFYPLGMKHKKKLSRFFIDQKLSKTDKEKIWVLEMDKKIVWVAGHRIDDRFKITTQTKNVLQLSLKTKDA